MDIEHIRNKRAFICDMDGVIYHGNHLLPGAAKFVNFLKEENKQFLFLTNSSERSPRELSEKMARLGIAVEASHFYTSALSTATFLASQKPGGSAYVIGEAGLIQALYEVGFSMNNVDPDYVVIGETRSYNFEKIADAVALIRKGAKLIGTNPDMTGPTERGIVPATGALVVPIEVAAGCKAYFLGKPNPLMMRIALKKLKAAPEDTVIIGDRMDTDILSGIESELETVLVFSGVTSPEDLLHFGYAPTYALPDVGSIAGV